MEEYFGNEIAADQSAAAEDMGYGNHVFRHGDARDPIGFDEQVTFVLVDWRSHLQVSGDMPGPRKISACARSVKRPDSLSWRAREADTSGTGQSALGRFDHESGQRHLVPECLRNGFGDGVGRGLRVAASAQDFLAERVAEDEALGEVRR